MKETRMKDPCVIFNIPLKTSRDQNILLRKKTEILVREQLRSRVRIESNNSYVPVSAVPSHRVVGDTHIVCCVEGLLLNAKEILSLFEKIVIVIRELFGECSIILHDKDKKVQEIKIDSTGYLPIPT
jgi:hypothetical protein